MFDYMALNVLSDDEAIVSAVLSEMLTLLKEHKGYIIYIGSLERAKRVASRESTALPFSALVTSFSELEDAMEKDEEIIFFDSDGKFQDALYTLENTPCMTFLTIGEHSPYVEDLKRVAEPNALAKLILASDGNRIFPFPKDLEITKEGIMDALVNIESITHNRFFNYDKPFYLVKEDDISIDYDWLKESAELLKIDIEIVGGGCEIKKEDCRAILSFSNLGHDKDMTLYYGLPFTYINAIREPRKALLSALRITKIIAKDFS